MMNENNDILLWYIDMIAGQGIDADGVPYFDDLYLDLVVYPDGAIIVDDMDELEEALSVKDITQQQFSLAINTSHKLKTGLLSNVDTFIEYTLRCSKILELQDYECDERGELPQDLKRGVLAQDALYDLLCGRENEERAL